VVNAVAKEDGCITAVSDARKQGKSAGYWPKVYSQLVGFRTLYSRSQRTVLLVRFIFCNSIIFIYEHFYLNQQSRALNRIKWPSWQNTGVSHFTKYKQLHACSSWLTVQYT
jgi:hypothetical protein